MRVSGWWFVNFWWSSGSNINDALCTGGSLFGGRFEFGSGPWPRDSGSFVPSPLRWNLNRKSSGATPFQGTQLPYVLTEGPGFVLGVPLWIPFLALLVPTVLLWRRDHKPRPTNHCKHCGYNLTDNESGICSECGTKIQVDPKAKS